MMIAYRFLWLSHAFERCAELPSYSVFVDPLYDELQTERKKHKDLLHETVSEKTHSMHRSEAALLIFQPWNAYYDSWDDDFSLK